MDKYYHPGVCINKYTIIKIIGEGRYGIVYLAENVIKEKVIMKQLKKEMLEKTREKLFYEVEILKKLDNYRFPKMIETFHFDDTEIYILEYIEGISFEKLLRKYNHKFTKTEIYNIAFKILDIIELLQQTNIVHRDIRTPNLILREDREIVLIDFGLARYIDYKKHKQDIDYWYMGDFLIHLFYTSFFQDDINLEERPWYDELSISEEEKVFLKKLMGIEKSYNSIDEIKYDLSKLKIINN